MYQSDCGIKSIVGDSRGIVVDLVVLGCLCGVGVLTECEGMCMIVVMLKVCVCS